MYVQPSLFRPSALIDIFLKRERFQALTEALEQHRKSTPLKKVHYYPPSESTVETESVSVTKDTEQQRDESESSSKQGVEGEEVNDENEDRDPESLYPPSSGGSSTSALTSAPCHRVPDNYISEDEDAGLPGTNDLCKYSFAKAEHVVQRHLKRSKSRSSGRLKKKRSHKRMSLDSEKDIEGEAAQHPPSQGGAGILSTLLNLYQHPELGYSDSGSSRASAYSFDYHSDSATEHMELFSPSERRRAAKREKMGKWITFGGYPFIFIVAPHCIRTRKGGEKSRKEGTGVQP